MGKLVAAALPMKAGTASAVAPKPAAPRVEATKSLANSGPPARPASKVSKDGSAGYGTSGAVEVSPGAFVRVPHLASHVSTGSREIPRVLKGDGNRQA